MRRPVVLVLAIAMSGPVGAAAQGAPDVEALAGQGRELYDKGEFTEAVAMYMRAYQAAPAAALLYNIAHIYDRKLGERELAIDFYRRYITSPDADPGVVARATERIQTLKKEAEAQATPPPPPVRALPDETAAPAPTAHAQTSSGGMGQRTWGWLAAGTGVALLAGGGVVGFLARDDADQFGKSTDLNRKQSLRDAGKAKALTADVLMGAGLAVGVTGAILILTAPDAPVAVVPTSSGGLVVFGGRL
jgi:tetratricopeptide (TPR) repeat protein